MSELTFKQIKELLTSKNVSFEVIEHKAVYTSKQAAKVRNGNIEDGIKALVLKNKKKEFFVALVSANKKVDLKRLAEITKTSRLSLAGKESVFEKTDCEIGSVPPFVGLLNNFKTFLDESILERENSIFNAGLHTISIKMKRMDLIDLLNPIILRFSIECISNKEH